MVISCIYNLASSFSEGLARVNKDGKEGFINKKGELAILCKYDLLKVFRGIGSCYKG